MLNTNAIYLASKSPRRQELLKLLGVPFEPLIVETPEIMKKGESVKDYSRRVTLEKAQAAWQKITEEQLEPRAILTADTEVILDGNILGKPKDKAHAFSMLKAYSNRTHQVLTSVCLKRENIEKVRQNTTLVSFSELTDEAIDAYLNQGDYLDKAGAYGIQSAIASYIKRLEGCFYSVMGLPLYDVRCLLES